MTLDCWRHGSGPDAQIIEGDGPRTLELLADDEIDAVVTDPPWNLGKRYGRHDDDMPRQTYLAWLALVVRAAHG